MNKIIQWGSVCLFLFCTHSALAAYSEKDSIITVKASSPSFELKLKSNPTTGYSWRLEKMDQHVFEEPKHHFVAPETGLMGAPGYEVWSFQLKRDAFKKPSEAVLTFVYQRPWEKDQNTPPLIIRVLTQP